MSTLTMALAAALLAGSAPEKVSGETRQPLDLRGEWEGTLDDNGTIFCGQLATTDQRGTKEMVFIYFDPPQARVYFLGGLPVEEGDGRFRAGDTLGIYQHDGGCLRICWRADGSRPRSLHDRKGDYLLTLRRVKPRK